MATVKLTETEKSKKDLEELEALKKKKAEAKNVAKENANVKASNKVEVDSELLSEGLDLAKKAFKNSKKKQKGFFKGIGIGFIIGALLMFIIGSNMVSGKIFNKVGAGKDYVDKLISERIINYTAVDFSEAILNEASEHQELIVMEQPVEISTTITKAGLGNLEIFSKTKNVTYAGTGVFTVDLNGFSEKNVKVDTDNMEIVLTIPKATLQYTNIDYENLEFEDTEKGFLSFGDIKLTVEEQAELEKSIIASMKERLQESDVLDKANEFAEMKVWQTFQPVVSTLNSYYTLEIEFED